MEGTMKGYALAMMGSSPTVDPEVVEYMEKVQETMDPFSGRFIIHGGTVEAVEGDWDRAVVMLEFPSMQHARDWYYSPAYQAIVRLRTDHLPGMVILVEGVKPGHSAAEKAAELRRATET
jgi:uncharacterized protein (DUF1330 family)